MNLQLDSQFPQNSDTCPKYTLNPNISTRHTTYGELVKIQARGRHDRGEQSEFQYKAYNIRRLNQNISAKRRQSRKNQSKHQYEKDNIGRISQNISTSQTMYGELVKISVRDTIYGELIKTSVRGRQHAEEQSGYQCEKDNIGAISQNISTRETAQGEPIRMPLSLRTREAIKTGFSQPGYHPPPLGRHNHLD